MLGRPGDGPGPCSWMTRGLPCTRCPHQPPSEQTLAVDTPQVPLLSWGRGACRVNPTCAPGPGGNRPLQAGHCSPQYLAHEWAGAPTPRKSCALSSEEGSRRPCLCTPPSRRPAGPAGPLTPLPCCLPAAPPAAHRSPVTPAHLPAPSGALPAPDGRGAPFSRVRETQVAGASTKTHAASTAVACPGGGSPWSGSGLCRAADGRWAHPVLQALGGQNIPECDPGLRKGSSETSHGHTRGRKIKNRFLCVCLVNPDPSGTSHH